MRAAFTANRLSIAPRINIPQAREESNPHISASESIRPEIVATGSP
jgi:hypothetical protein